MENTGYIATPPERDVGKILSNVMTGVYLYMFIGLLITAATAFFAARSETFIIMLLNNPAVFYGLIIGELALVFILSLAIRKMPFAMCLACFMIYSLVNGLTLSVIFLIYVSSSIYSTFLVTCLTFGIMSAIGYFTKKDLTKIGHFLLMGLIGIIIAGIVNIFIMSDVFSFAITVVGLLIFIGLTAFDTQRIKARLLEETNEDNFQKITIWGALTLYLDFINIFLKLLRILGRRRN